MLGGGEGEVKVVSVETRGQLDAGWLAARGATLMKYSYNLEWVANLVRLSL